MFVVAILIGFYSYGIFLLGILGFLTQTVVISYSLALLITLLFYFRRTILLNIHKLFNFLLNLKRWDKFYLSLIAILALINFIGALGPETAFDALWYHLTLPKIYLSEGKIFYLQGSLLYYSAMPKLIEMLYVAALSFDKEILAKLIHFSFGMGSLLVLYKTSRVCLSQKFSILVLLIFYSNLVVAWQSTTAYIDLGRTFFEVAAFFSIVRYVDTKNKKFLVLGAILLGFAISTKILAIVTLLIFAILLIILRTSIVSLLKFILISLLIPLPWFIFSYISTGNPFYPFFSDVYKASPSINFNSFLSFVHSQDPISPIYLISFPLIFWVFRRFDQKLKVVAYYSALAFFFWYITPQTGGGRFIMPYLPAFSILVAAIIFNMKSRLIKSYLVLLIVIIAVISIAYRSVANAKYLPVIAGYESKHAFLSKNLNFPYGDFYDTDRFFEKRIKRGDRVLIYGTHNLYYVNFPFFHESYLSEEDEFNYVLTQNADLPEKYYSWKLVYQNKQTNVKLYSKN